MDQVYLANISSPGLLLERIRRLSALEMTANELPLSKIPVLVLDCQATGPNPKTNHLIEIGWTTTSAVVSLEKGLTDVKTYKVAIPPGGMVPPGVQRVTGLSPGSLVKGLAPSGVWELILRDLDTTLENPSCTVPTIIHFARFETPFLTRLHNLYRKGEKFPLEIFCTWEITRRLLSHLPRRGLRAVAGYLGHSIPELRRSAHHVAATASVWQASVEMLESEHEIRTLQELREWLAKPFNPRATRKVYPMKPEIRLGVPEEPGVYRMLRSNGDIIYVGKAKSLKRRVNSYFQKQTRHAEHILEMLSQAQNLTVTVTGSALEAALLENDEIKAVSPPYNVALRGRNRQIGYFSKGLDSFSRSPDCKHTQGPFPSPELFFTVSRLLDLLRGDGSALHEFSPSDLLLIPENYTPEQDLFTAGFKAFSEEFGSQLSQEPQCLLAKRLGTQFWLEAQESRALAELTDPEAEEEEGKDTGEWTEETVVRTIKSLFLRAAHLQRRARWFRLLSNCCLSWKSPDQTEWIQLSFQDGNIANRQSANKLQRVHPPGSVWFPNTLIQMDATTYDRLSVLTTELKRLCGQSRELIISPKPGTELDLAKTSRILFWL